jgi:predicted SAM-dependent methyltransferase
MKLHIGCGTVYLSGWVNVDVPGPKTFLAEKRPDLVDRWLTTEDNYYGRHTDKSVDTLAQGPLDQEYVCDQYGDFTSLNFPYESFDEVLIRQTFEHLSIAEAQNALDTIEALMPYGGVLRIDVPDHEKTLQLFKETGKDFYVRHLLGPRRNDYGYHMMSYTPDRLQRLVERHGFRFVCQEDNIHLYPAFCLRFVKRALDGPLSYVPFPVAIPDSWRCADVGPGGYPWPRANVYIDRSAATLGAIKLRDGQTIMEADLRRGLSDIPDKHFDYLWCSHVLEHVPNPSMVAQTFTRIAKRGTVVLPSFFKESLFHFEEADHKWLILPHPTNKQTPIFVRHNERFISKLRNAEMQKITCQLYRTGPTRHGEDQRYMRNWFKDNESSTDVVVHWEAEFNPVVIG